MQMLIWSIANDDDAYKSHACSQAMTFGQLVGTGITWRDFVTSWGSSGNRQQFRWYNCTRETHWPSNNVTLFCFFMYVCVCIRMNSGWKSYPKTSSSSSSRTTAPTWTARKWEKKSKIKRDVQNKVRRETDECGCRRWRINKKEKQR